MAAPPPPRRGLLARELVLLLLFLAGAAASWLGLVHLRQRFLLESFQVNGEAPIPVERVRLKERDAYPVHFLLVHGYSANRRQLLHLAEVLAAAGADVFVLDLPGRGDNTAEASLRPNGQSGSAMITPRETEAALAAVRHLEHNFHVPLDRLAVVGHSLGGGVALEVGRLTTSVATISLAGLERPVAPASPRNLLLITASLEIPPLRRAADRMYARARAGSTRRDSLLARREFRATHASLPFHSPVQQAIVDWTNRALPDARLDVSPFFNEWLLVLEWSALFFLVGLVVPLAGLAAWALAHEPLGEVVPETRLTLWSSVHLAGYALLAGAAVVSGIYLLHWLGWPHPLRFLHLAEGDYLASVLLLCTLWLLPALRHRPWIRSGRETAAHVGVAVALAAYVIMVGGGFLTWQLFDLWPTLGRLARMLLLGVLLFPYTLGEELLLRTVSKQARGTSALSAFLVWRVGLLAAILYGVLVLDRAQDMLIVMALPLVLLSLLEYFFAATLYRALGSPYADAALKAVLLGWIIATVFPLR